MNEHIEQRFFNKVDKTYGCWNWIAHKNPAGYGRITVNRKDYTAHRMSWILHKGAIPGGLFVCHHCDNPACCNPNHLFIGTNRDNRRDSVKKGRQHKPKYSDLYVATGKLQRGEDNPAAVLTEEKVREIVSFIFIFITFIK